MEPMLASPAQEPPTGPHWVHEVKWDGMRVLADIRDGRVRLSARSGADATTRFPELSGLADAHPDVMLDGEVVAMHDGLPSFTRLIDRIHVRDAGMARRLAAANPVTYMCFDVLRLDGHDLQGMPWRDRRSLLDALALASRHVVVPPVYPDGASLLEATRQSGLEGIVSKRRDSLYEPGRRSGSWRKIAHRPTVSTIVGGWRPEIGSGMGLGALLVGLPTARGLRFAGRVGSGFGTVAERTLLPRLLELEQDCSPFAGDIPAADHNGSRWVAPALVVDVRALGAVGHRAPGRLRQPVYLGVRGDLRPADLSLSTMFDDGGEADG